MKRPFTFTLPFLTLLGVISLGVISVSAMASEWEWAPFLPKGTALPHFEAVDSDGVQRHSDQLRGENGMLLFFNRSTVW